MFNESDIEAIADEVAAADYEFTKPPRGRPPVENSMDETIPVRLDGKLKGAVEQRARDEQTTNSDVVRAALRHYLAS